MNPVTQVAQPRPRQRFHLTGPPIKPGSSSASWRETALGAFGLSCSVLDSGSERSYGSGGATSISTTRLVRVVEFASTLGHDLVRSDGKSPDAVRTIEIDQHLVEVLERQKSLQSDDRKRSSNYEATDFVFTKPNGGSYHPQYLSRRLGALSVECGLPRLTAHGLRHTLLDHDARSRGGGEGCGRAAGPFRYCSIPQPVQPCDAHDAD